MKYSICCFLAFMMFSCNNGYEEDISNIEYLLGTKLDVPYEIENVETPFDFAEYYISFDVKFDKSDFDHLLKSINIKKFEKNDILIPEIQSRQGYYRQITEEGERMSLFIDTDDNSLHYSSKR